MRKFMIATAVLTAVLAGSAQAQPQDRWDWSGGRNDGPEWRFDGPGVPMLLPELRDTPRGRAFVLRNFDFNHDRVIEPREARAANDAFMAAAGRDRGRFDWDARDRGFHPPAPMRDGGMAGGGWDRRAMHDYGFRQTPRGASFNLSEDVLFATDSAVLRPGAIDRLRPLADYLQGQRGVRVSIDGYTDARGSDAHNLTLSQNRAASVRDALSNMGVVRARFQITGHGKNDPVASNATPDGMRKNRRVEVTLLGQRAQNF